MKKLSFLPVFLLVLGLVFGAAYSAYAAEDLDSSKSNIETVAPAVEDLPSAGITPDSRWYFFDIAWEKIGTFFTFGKAKAYRYARLAGERIAEAGMMAEKKDAKSLGIATDRFSKMLNRAERHTEKFVNDPVLLPELESIFIKATSKYPIALKSVLIKAPEVTHESLQNAIERSTAKHEEHFRKLIGLDVEKAVRVHREILEKVTYELERPPKEIELREHILKDIEALSEVKSDILEKAESYELPIQERVLRTVEETTKAYVKDLRRIIDAVPLVEERELMQKMIEVGETSTKDILYKLEAIKIEGVEAIKIEESSTVMPTMPAAEETQF